MTRLHTFLFAVTFIGGAAALAGDAARAADPPPTAEVLGKLHRSNLKEIEMGNMAIEQGHSKEVKSFGETLVKDHGDADKKVAKLAKDEKIDLEAATPEKKTEDMPAAGADFDAAFAKSMVEDHEKDVAEVKAARDATKDP